MKLLIKADTPEIRKLYEGHGAMYKGDSGVDIFCHEEQVIHTAGQKIKFGIHCAMVNDSGEFVSYILMPRSSISKTPLRMSNSIGLIDSSYRGELMAPVDIQIYGTVENNVRIKNLHSDDHTECGPNSCVYDKNNIYTCGRSSSNRFTYIVEKNTRMFQIVAPGYVPFTIELVSELPDTERGSGGFGSTGV